MFGFSIQPTEFIKPALILLNSIFLEKIFETDNKKYLIFPLTLYVICSIFIIKQPDIGTLILLSTVFFAQIFLLDIIKIKYYICLFIGSVFVIFVLYKTLPHVSNRIDNFLSSIKNPDNANYQVRRSLLAYKNSSKNDGRKNIIVSTAEWSKFAPTITKALHLDSINNDKDALHYISNKFALPIHKNIESLFNKNECNKTIINNDNISDVIKEWLKTIS